MTRIDALRDAAAIAVRLVLGVVPLLVIAGTIEGFVSPSDIPVAAKFTIGAAALFLLVSYVSLAARADDGHGVSQTPVASLFD
jgi:hypothetical protein